MSPFAPKSRPKFSACIGASIVISSRSRISSSHLVDNSQVITAGLSWLSLIPWDELEDDDASQFCKGFGAPAKPFRMALGALIIKARLGLTDEELVEQIKENLYLQFFIGLEGYQYSAPFDPSIMVYSGNGCRNRW